MAKKDGNLGLWKVLFPVFGAILLSWAAYEIAFLPILRPNRGNLDPSLNSKQGNGPHEEAAAVETRKSEEEGEEVLQEISGVDSSASVPKQE